MLKFSVQKTGLPVSYIQLQGVGVSIAASADANCTCAVFHDPNDVAQTTRHSEQTVKRRPEAGWQRWTTGRSHSVVVASSLRPPALRVSVCADAQGSDFGKLLSRELLDSFVHTYSAELNQGAGAGAGPGGGRGSSGTGTGVFSMDHYAEFQSSIASIIRNAVKPLLDQRQWKASDGQGRGKPRSDLP